MTIVYTSLKPEVTIHGNILTLHKLTFSHVQMLSEGRSIECFSVEKTGGTENNPLYDMSYAMRALEHKTYAGHIHRHNAEQRAKNPHLEPNGNGPKGTPPTGGTPGAARVTKFENTVAIAA